MTNTFLIMDPYHLTNHTVTIEQYIKANKHPNPHALYDGVVFVVWSFGIYLFLCGTAKLINSLRK